MAKLKCSSIKKYLLIFSLFLFFVFCSTANAGSVSLVSPADPGNGAITISSFSQTFLTFFTSVGYSTSTSFAYGLWDCKSDSSCSSSYLRDYGYFDPVFGYITTNYPFDHSSDGYWQMTITCGGVECGNLDFNVNEGASATNLGFWGNIANNLFVPRPTFLSGFILDLNSTMEEVAPFCYFYEIQDIFSDQTVSSTTLNLQLSIPFSGGTTTFSFLNTGETNLNSFLTLIRPFIIAGLWVLFGVYLFERIMDLQF